VTPDEYLIASYAVLSKNERSVQDKIKALLLLLLWRLRQSLLSSLPSTGMSRYVIWSSLLPTLIFELRDYNNAFRTILLQELETVEREHVARASSYAGLAATLRDYKPRTGDTLLKTTRSGGRTLFALFEVNPITDTSPFMDAHLRSIRAKVETGLMREDTTIEIARTVVAERTRRGYVQPKNARGTTYSAILNRDNALIANSVWDVSGHVERAIFARQQQKTATTPAPFAAGGWVWHSILDPKTCPICRPLDGRRGATQTDFPYIPPVHPRCRCRILPAT
jgi:hypothetical protein